MKMGNECLQKTECIFQDTNLTLSSVTCHNGHNTQKASQMAEQLSWSTFSSVVCVYIYVYVCVCVYIHTSKSQEQSGSICHELSERDQRAKCGVFSGGWTDAEQELVEKKPAQWCRAQTHEGFTVALRKHLKTFKDAFWENTPPGFRVTGKWKWCAAADVGGVEPVNSVRLM